MAIDRNAIARRSARRAADKYAAANARIEAQGAAARKGYRTEVGATRGAAKMSRDALNSQLAGLKDSGLHGLALRQVKDELLGQLESTHGMVAFDKATLKPELQNTLATLDDKAFTLSQSEASAAESLYNSGVTRQRALAKKQTARVRTAAAKVDDPIKAGIEKGKSFDQEVKDALGEIRYVYEDAYGPGAASMQAGRDDLKSGAAVRKAAVDKLVATQGISRKAATAAIKLFVRRHSNPLNIASSSPTRAAGIVGGVVDNTDFGG